MLAGEGSRSAAHWLSSLASGVGEGARVRVNFIVKKTFSYDEIKAFYDGPAAEKLGKLWDFIAETGNEIIPLKYAKAASFRKGEAQIEIDGDIYRINVSDEIVGQGVK